MCSSTDRQQWWSLDKWSLQYLSIFYQATQHDNHSTLPVKDHLPEIPDSAFHRILSYYESILMLIALQKRVKESFFLQSNLHLQKQREYNPVIPSLTQHAIDHLVIIQCLIHPWRLYQRSTNQGGSLHCGSCQGLQEPCFLLRFLD